MMIEEMITKALEARKNAYAPYSGFTVGACVQTRQGNLYTGCNIESVSYSPTICAERVAIANAVSHGEHDLVSIAIAGAARDTFPCGVCRQMMREFSSDMQIIIVNSKDDYKIFSLRELLPHSFGPEVLKEDF